MHDEQPSPAGETPHTIHTLWYVSYRSFGIRIRTYSKDTSCDKAGESSGKDLSAVQKCNSSGNFFACIEDGEHVGCPRIKLVKCQLRAVRAAAWKTHWSLGDAQEETTCDKALVALYQTGAGRYDCPNHHPATHVDAGVYACNEHVGWNLHEHVTHKKTVVMISRATSKFLRAAAYMETVVLNWTPVMPRSFSRLFSRACAIAFRST